jgi:hypothetical protein
VASSALGADDGASGAANEEKEDEEENEDATARVASAASGAGAPAEGASSEPVARRECTRRYAPVDTPAAERESPEKRGSPDSKAGSTVPLRSILRALSADIKKSRDLGGSSSHEENCAHTRERRRDTVSPEENSTSLKPSHESPDLRTKQNEAPLAVAVEAVVEARSIAVGGAGGAPLPVAPIAAPFDGGGKCAARSAFIALRASM